MIIYDSLVLRTMIVNVLSGWRAPPGRVHSCLLILNCLIRSGKLQASTNNKYSYSYRPPYCCLRYIVVRSLVGSRLLRFHEFAHYSLLRRAPTTPSAFIYAKSIRRRWLSSSLATLASLQCFKPFVCLSFKSFTQRRCF